jgi:5-methylcytosine-specific restriction endonuclease McrA
MYAPIISPTDRPPKLRVELVPQTCWLSDVKSFMTDHFWRSLSRDIAEENGMRCEVCSDPGRQHAVECHEVWLYDNARRVQTLLRLQALCPMCHRVKHLDRTISNGYGDQACVRLARVNGWDAAMTSGM